MPYKDTEKRRQRARDWAKAHPERVAINSRKYLLKRRYSSEMNRFDDMFKEQNGKCAICKSEELDKRLSVDRDHETGRVRGLLCHRCNLALGLIQDNTITLTNMINYINWK